MFHFVMHFEISFCNDFMPYAFYVRFCNDFDGLYPLYVSFYKDIIGLRALYVFIIINTKYVTLTQN